MALEDKVALVTGAGRGMGRAIAIALAGDGATVALSDIDVETLEEATTTVRAMGNPALAIQADVGDLSDIDRMVKETVDTFGRVDILVNNAGVTRYLNIMDVREEDWDRIHRVNAKGVFFCMQKVAAELIRQSQGGRIINIASIAGTFGGPTSSPPYAAAKAGLVNLTTVAAAALAQYGIRVNAIAPGIINPPFHAPVDIAIGQEQLGLKPGEHIHTRVSLIPLGRLGEPEDIAATVAFLASEDASHISGETITVAGAMRSL